MSPPIREYHLIDNPFQPPSAERRKPEDIIIVGDKHQEVLKAIIDVVSSNHSHLIIVHGDWGTGKTALIKKAIYELESSLRDKLIATHFRLPRDGITFDELVFGLVKELYDSAYNKASISEGIAKIIKSWKSLEEEGEKISLKEIRKAKDILFTLLGDLVKQGKKVVIALDQFENLKVTKKNDEQFLNFLRDLFDEIGKQGQLVIILSVIAKKLRNMYDDEVWSKFIGSTSIYGLEYLGRDDVILLFKTLLERYREPEFKEHYKNKPLAPFTTDAIEEIRRIANGNTRAIFDIAARVLDRAVRKGSIGTIDSTLVKYLSGKYDFRWIDAIETLPYMELLELTRRILEYSRRLLDIIYFPTNIISRDNYSYFLRPKQQLNDEDLERLLDHLRKGSNFFVYHKSPKGDKLYIIKVSERLIRRDVVNNLHNALALSEPTFAESPIPPVNVSIILLTGGTISSQAIQAARGLEVAFGIKVKEKIIDTSEPESYGRLRSLVDRIEDLEEIYGDLDFAPEDELDEIGEELRESLKILGIYIK